MSSDHLQQAHDLFMQVVGLPDVQRDRVLAQACADNQELRREVESLLTHDAAPTERFLPIIEQEVWPGGSQTVAASRPNTDRVDLQSYPKIPGYEVIRELGHGAMGVVYQARDIRLDRLVAVKTILGAYQSGERLRLLRREAQLAARLRHQNIVSVYQLIETAEPPCVVMEWVDGEPLGEVWRRLSFQHIAVLMKKVAMAVSYAHSMGVVHRDLKPGNILVDRQGEPRLLDFGLARIIVSPSEASSTNAIKGTPLYMAPEQFTSPGDVGPAADIYALGLILYALVAGATPPAPRSPATLLEWSTRQFPLPRLINPDCPEPLQRICLKACERSPDDRYASAEQMADDLQRYLDDRPVRARPSAYAMLLEERVRTHIEAVGEWQAENLISRRESDSILSRYLRVLQKESLWAPGSRRLRGGPMLVQVGGWLVVVSTLLWLGFYWSRLTSLERIFAIGGPTFVINAAAMGLWRRKSDLLAILFSVVGALLVPLCSMVVLYELRILEIRYLREDSRSAWISTLHRYPDGRGDFAVKVSDGSYLYLSADSGSVWTSHELLPASYFANVQIAFSFWLASAYTAMLLQFRRYTVLSGTLCVLLVFAAVATLLILGLKYWVVKQEFATAAAMFAPVSIAAHLIARRLDRRELDHLAGPFYATAGLSFLGVLGVLVWDVPESWFNLPRHVEGIAVNPLFVGRELLLFLAALAVFKVALIHERSESRLQRAWGQFYFKVVPPCLIASVHFLANEEMWVIARLGREEMRLLELAVPLMCTGFIVAGVRLQLRWFSYYALLHLAVFLALATYRHFEDHRVWPIVVSGIGAMTIAVGLWIEHRRRLLDVSSGEFATRG